MSKYDNPDVRIDNQKATIIAFHAKIDKVKTTLKNLQKYGTATREFYLKEDIDNLLEELGKD